MLSSQVPSQSGERTPEPLRACHFTFEASSIEYVTGTPHMTHIFQHVESAWTLPKVGQVNPESIVGAIKR